MSGPLRVAIVGSRSFGDFARVRRFVAALARRHPGCVVMSGGAPGVDREAAAAARAAGLVVRELPADWARFGRWAGHKRNQELVCNSDIVIAFWDGSSAGTRHVINLARAAMKKVYVYGPEGGDSPSQSTLW
jgi:predicted Rossmann fold nucleotide-binding protein DprA/Smf involved in DNA uptake